MSGDESLLLRRRLSREFGLDVHTFRYSAAGSTMTETTSRLQKFVRRLEASGLRTARLHFVGHSLGGLVIYRFLERYPQQPPGHVVFLGTPAVASRAAVQAGHIRLVASLMGRSVADELLRPRERRWKSERPLGIIAGTNPLGVGQILARFDEDCDGTIGVSETQLPGATDHITLPVSHLGMLVSPRVARATGSFLQNGRFPIR
jgi:pimeloyl-ACP methyl ester carboxylesterase